MNYTELYDAVIAETENTDDTFVANIPVFVKNAEKRIYQAVKIPAFRKNATSVLIPSTPYVTLPTDFMSAWEFAVLDGTVYTYLLAKDVSFIREAYPDTAVTGVPKYYSIFDADTILFAPTPASDLSIEMHYFYYPESIVTASTTWVGDNFDNVLLYGALVEAAVFMKSEEDILKAYSEQYAFNMKLLKVYSESSLRSGEYRK
jgi:hypothetical protein